MTKLASEGGSDVTAAGDLMGAVAEWASDWADEFDQTWTPEMLEGWVGKTVRATKETPEGPKGFTKTIVGFSQDVLMVSGRKVYRSSFITADGAQVALFTDMRVEEHQE